MKALTICQPYAELIARGVKLIENRTWPTAYRGPLLILAGKSRDWLCEGDDAEFPNMAFGAAVATAVLYDCLPVADLPEYLRGHEHADGPWCWLLRNVRRVPSPIPMRGAQGLWEADFPAAPTAEER